VDRVVMASSHKPSALSEVMATIQGSVFPRLRVLTSFLKTHYSSQKDFHGIVFVRSREGANRLAGQCSGLQEAWWQPWSLELWTCQLLN
jgi:hypothetical protein